MYTRRIFPLIGTFLFVLLPGVALADVWFNNPLYHTYGNTAAYTGDAFLQLAHVMGQNGFRGMFVAFTTIGLFVGGCNALFSQVKSMNGSAGPWIHWAGTVVLGVGIYMSYIVPVSDLTIIDETGGATSLAPDVPDGVINIAMIMNRIETGMINIMDIGITGLTYEDMAGGVAYQLIAKLFTGQLSTTVYPLHLKQSIENYYNDCVVFEGMRPGGALSAESFANAKWTSLKPVYALAALHGVNTTYVDNAGAKLSATCWQAWNGNGGSVTGLNNEMSAAMATGYIEDQCLAMGFEKGGAVTSRIAGLGGSINNMAVCRNMMTRVFSALMSTDANSATIGDMTNNIAWNRAMIEAMYGASATGDAARTAKITGSTQFMSSGIGMGITASEWMPVIRTMVLAVFLGIVPFVLVFLPTPLLGKVLSFVAGGMMFIAAWGVCDAVMTQLTVQYAFNNLRAISGDGINFLNMIQVPDHLAKIMGMLGYLRTSAIMFAALITSMLFKFGGHALSSLAGNISGTIQSAGAAGGAAGLTPQGQASVMASAVNIPNSIASSRGTWEEQGGFDGIHRTSYANATMGAARSKGSAGTAYDQGLDHAADAAEWEGKTSVGNTLNAHRGFTKARTQGERIVSEDEGVMVATRGAGFDSAGKFGEGLTMEDPVAVAARGRAVGLDSGHGKMKSGRAIIDSAQRHGHGSDIEGYTEEVSGVTAYDAKTADLNKGQGLLKSAKMAGALASLGKEPLVAVGEAADKRGVAEGANAFEKGNAFNNEGEAWRTGRDTGREATRESVGASNAVRAGAKDSGMSVDAFIDHTATNVGAWGMSRKLGEGHVFKDSDDASEHGSRDGRFSGTALKTKVDKRGNPDNAGAAAGATEGTAQRVRGNMFGGSSGASSEEIAHNVEVVVRRNEKFKVSEEKGTASAMGSDSHAVSLGDKNANSKVGGMVGKLDHTGSAQDNFELARDDAEFGVDATKGSVRQKKAFGPKMSHTIAEESAASAEASKQADLAARKISQGIATGGVLGEALIGQGEDMASTISSSSPAGAQAVNESLARNTVAVTPSNVGQVKKSMTERGVDADTVSSVQPGSIANVGMTFDKESGHVSVASANVHKGTDVSNSNSVKAGDTAGFISPQAAYNAIESGDIATDSRFMAMTANEGAVRDTIKGYFQIAAMGADLKRVDSGGTRGNIGVGGQGGTTTGTPGGYGAPGGTPSRARAMSRVGAQLGGDIFTQSQTQQSVDQYTRQAMRIYDELKDESGAIPQSNLGEFASRMKQIGREIKADVGMTGTTVIQGAATNPERKMKQANDGIIETVKHPIDSGKKYFNNLHEHNEERRWGKSLEEDARKHED